MGKNSFKIAVVLLLLAVFAGSMLVAGCNSKVADVKTIKPGILLVGSEGTYPPFEMSVDGKSTGFDIDIANALAARLGLKAQTVKTKFKSMIPGLVAGNYDVIISAMTITPARAKVISFSKPYMTADQSICVRMNSGIKTSADLAGKIVGVETDTTGQLKALELQKSVGIKKVQSFDNIKLAFEALEIGRIDAIINDFPVNAYMSAQTQNTEVASLIKTNESYGIGVALRNAQMLAGVDKALAAIKADGTYKSIYDKWFAPVTN